MREMTVTVKAKLRPLQEAIAILLEAAAQVSKVKALTPIENKLRRAMQAIFAKQGRIFLHELERYRGEFAEAIDAGELDRMMAAVVVETEDEMSGAIQAAGGEAILAAAKHRIAEVGVDIAFDLKNPRAVAYLKENAALRVTQISETTKSRMATILTQSTDEGWSYGRTAKEIKERFTEFRVGKPQLHIQSRAHLVAVTESANAYETGNEIVVDEMTKVGLKMQKSWSNVGDDRVSDGCLINTGDGWIPAKDSHSSGHMHPPRFPGCRCGELYRRKP